MELDDLWLIARGINPNFLTEAASNKTFKFITSNTKITSEDITDEEQQKIVDTLNKNWDKIKKEIIKYIEPLISEWYKNNDGSYKYGINTAEKVLKFATITSVNITKMHNDMYYIEICYNGNTKNKNAEKFFFGHSLVCEIHISKDFQVGKTYYRLEG